MFIFETFPVYQKAENFYQSLLSLIELNKIRPNSAYQLERAALSILCNISEGSGKCSRKDKRNFYVIARGSCHECASIVRQLTKRDPQELYFQNWYQELTIIPEKRKD
ncbi:MAG: hypothetical protein A2V81_05005 [Candidatus Abawacabacteria bacterium RBG_16_42_10]|uniref:Four helix bundle protein n=1 Tax=Candidatus Abawacabacteria bacterium RBG_16_42_10 TaxID=1817814 RepID=A0A1F4XJ37_9BACT|nr:MAG: hypothetical protein A2V81_05005 [Candidatus Abawacabacteria bacterium RBG_16_42_10]